MRNRSRRTVLALLGALGSLAATAVPPTVTAHHDHKRRRKRCDKQCKQNRKTCDRGCAILDDDSEAFCKQSCHVALSQCKANC